VLFEPSETPYDLRWRMFGIDVRVHPMFWLLSAVLGWSWVDSPGGRVEYLLLWIACVFVSILLHELGHVLVGRLFGAYGHIVLYGFGGLAIGSSALNKRWQRIAVYLAGPGIQLALYGLLLLAEPHLFDLVDNPTWNKWTFLTLYMLMEINLFWPILNLLPIYPLDGGQTSREVCQAISPRHGTRVSLQISIAFAAVLALHALACKLYHQGIPYVPPMGLYAALLFGMLAASSYQMLQAYNEQDRHWDYGDPDDSLPWERERRRERW
jgi:Zn-dependent protease